MSTHESWGRYPPSRPARVFDLTWATTQPPADDLLLPYGLGRSYGDVPLNNGHTLLDTSRLNRFLSFDDATGLLECEAGTTLEDILRLAVPRGWFLPVTPGTKFVTVGGCIANDVHGKNHHRAGTFGRHVRSFELVRSDGTRLHCSAEENAELFRATIGGLGLTGLMTTASIQLRPIESADVIVERVPFRSLDEFDAISRACDATHEYTVAWFDSFAGRDSRGIFFKGNHAPGSLSARRSIRKRQLRLPHSKLMAPFLNPSTVRAFNTGYFLANAKPKPQRLDYDPFFYPLDAVANWNAMYGARLPAVSVRDSGERGAGAGGGDPRPCCAVAAGVVSDRHQEVRRAAVAGAAVVSARRDDGLFRFRRAQDGDAAADARTLRRCRRGRGRLGVSGQGRPHVRSALPSLFPAMGGTAAHRPTRGSRRRSGGG